MSILGEWNVVNSESDNEDAGVLKLLKNAFSLVKRHLSWVNDPDDPTNQELDIYQVTRNPLRPWALLKKFVGENAQDDPLPAATLVMGMASGIDIVCKISEVVYQDPISTTFFEKCLKKESPKCYELFANADEEVKQEFMRGIESFHESFLVELKLEDVLEEICAQNRVTISTHKTLARLIGKRTRHGAYNEVAPQRPFVVPASVLEQHGLTPGGTLLDKEKQPSPKQVRTALKRILEKQKAGYEGKPRRTPERIPRILATFSQRESELVFLEEFLSAFENSKDPRKHASSALSETNKLLKEEDEPVEIDSIRLTAYFFRNRDTE